MRRLARWTLNALTVLSLLMCVVAAGVWAAAPKPLALPVHFSGDPERTGFMQPHLTVEGATASWGDSRMEWGPAAPIAVRRVAFWGFKYEWASSPATPPICAFVSRRVSVSLPGCIAASVALPAWRLASAARRRRRQTRLGRCDLCSYDLTGNVSGVCPECGTKLTTPPPPNHSDAPSPAAARPL